MIFLVCYSLYFQTLKIDCIKFESAMPLRYRVNCVGKVIEITTAIYNISWSNARHNENRQMSMRHFSMSHSGLWLYNHKTNHTAEINHEIYPNPKPNLGLTLNKTLTHQANLKFNPHAQVSHAIVTHAYVSMDLLNNFRANFFTIGWLILDIFLLTLCFESVALESPVFRYCQGGNLKRQV